MIDQRRPVTERELEERMRPGMLSQTGFLGKSERLIDVLQQDRKRLEELRITAEDIAVRLEALVRPAVESTARRAVVGHFDVRVVLYTGFQMCPWSPDIHHTQCTAGGGVRYGSVDWSITNKKTGEVIAGSGLLIHLIRAHEFFEGSGSPHRLDPGSLARLLELGPFARS